MKVCPENSHREEQRWFVETVFKVEQFKVLIKFYVRFMYKWNEGMEIKEWNWILLNQSNVNDANVRTSSTKKWLKKNSFGVGVKLENFPSLEKNENPLYRFLYLFLISSFYHHLCSILTWAIHWNHAECLISFSGFPIKVVLVKLVLSLLKITTRGTTERNTEKEEGFSSIWGLRRYKSFTHPILPCPMFN